MHSAPRLFKTVCGSGGRSLMRNLGRSFDRSLLLADRTESRAFLWHVISFLIAVGIRVPITGVAFSPPIIVRLIQLERLRRATVTSTIRNPIAIAGHFRRRRFRLARL